MSSCTSCEEALYFYFFFFQAEDGIRDIWRDWSSDVCSSDLAGARRLPIRRDDQQPAAGLLRDGPAARDRARRRRAGGPFGRRATRDLAGRRGLGPLRRAGRSEERRVGKKCRSRWFSFPLKKK